MGALWVLLAQIAIMVLFGFVLHKTHIIDASFRARLSTLLLRAVLPAGILVSGNSEFVPSMGIGVLQAGIIAVGYYVLALVAVVVLSRAMKLPSEKSGLFANMSVFANTAFIGFPIASALFGSEGVLYAVIYNLAFQLFLFTIGVRLLNKEEKFNWKKFLLDPMMIVSVLAIVIFFSPFRLPEVVLGAFNQIGQLSAPLSLIIIGSNLAEIKLSSLWNNPLSYVVSFLRMLVFPLAMLGVLWALGMRGVLPASCVLLTALPVGSTNVILAEQQQKDVRFAASTVLQSMVLMIVCLPIVLYAINMFLMV
ncbi:MAG: AEC family transporter [Oscillospiraceae bacterium]